jgi:hypothetical protein
MLEMLCQAIKPALRLADCLANWATIVRHLREPPRRRRVQADMLDDILETFG